MVVQALVPLYELADPSPIAYDLLLECNPLTTNLTEANIAAQLPNFPLDILKPPTLTSSQVIQQATKQSAAEQLDDDLAFFTDLFNHAGSSNKCLHIPTGSTVMPDHKKHTPNTASPMETDKMVDNPKYLTTTPSSMAKHPAAKCANLSTGSESSSTIDPTANEGMDLDDAQDTLPDMVYPDDDSYPYPEHNGIMQTEIEQILYTANHVCPDHLADVHAMICHLSPEGSFAPKTVQFDVTPIKLQICKWSSQPNP